MLVAVVLCFVVTELPQGVLTIYRYIARDFFTFSFRHNGRPPSWIFESANFRRPIWSDGLICVIMPNFIEIISRTVAAMSRFYGFQNGGCPSSWII